MALSSEHVNSLIYQYLVENGTCNLGVAACILLTAQHCLSSSGAASALAA